VPRDSIRDANGKGGLHQDAIATVMFVGRAHVPTLFAMGVPAAPVIAPLIHQDPCALRGDRSRPEVPGPIEVLPGRDSLTALGRAEEVESQLSLREEKVPLVLGEGGIKDGHDALDVFLD